MAFWSKKKLFDILMKNFKNDNISVEFEENRLTFEMYFEEAKFNLYPYIKLDENESIMSIFVNIRKIEKENVYEKINNFNLISKYFTLKLKDNVLYLEYNAFVDNDNVYDVTKKATTALNDLQLEIDKI